MKKGYVSPVLLLGRKEKPLQKSLSIKYISCEEKGILLNLKFEVDAKNLNPKETKAYLNVFRGDLSQNNLKESAIAFVDINSNGRKTVEVLVPLSFINHEFYKTNKYYRASVTVDGFFALSEGFEIEFKRSTSSILQGCGNEYRNKIRCTEYNGAFGPEYSGVISLKNFKYWDKLTTSSIITVDEKDILIAMSENEGNLDCVQSYDSEILSAGAMQKTVSITGEGEFPIQLYEFIIMHKEKGKKIESCGWKVEEKDSKYIISYNGMTGKDLKNYIRIGFNRESFKKNIECKPLEPIINLLNDTDFQTKQIVDFIERLHFCLQIQPSNYSFRIKDFVKSKLGKAVVLDHHVNRKSHVKKCFGEALDLFFKQNTQVSKNPNDWGNNFSAFENKILEIYGPLRGNKNEGYSMTNAIKRYNELKNKL